MFRVRGKVGQAIEPAEIAGKWFFSIWMVPFGQGEGDDSHKLGDFGPYGSEDEAKNQLEAAASDVCDEIQKSAMGKTTGTYIDMKDNLTKRWPAQVYKFPGKSDK